jgi:hypothetical protein
MIAVQCAPTSNLFMRVGGNVAHQLAGEVISNVGGVRKKWKPGTGGELCEKVVTHGFALTGKTFHPQSPNDRALDELYKIIRCVGVSAEVAIRWEVGQDAFERHLGFR